MQERYIDFTGFLPVPYTARKFKISMHGYVVNADNCLEVSGDTLPTGEITATINNGLEWMCLKTSVLLAIVSKNIRVPSNLWKYIDVLYIDGNPTNFHPSNVVWKYPLQGLKYKNSSKFRYIPGYNRYVCDIHGNVFDTINQKSLNEYSDKLGYSMYSVVPDVGKRTILGRHRAIALAFLSYPSNVDSLDVNHIDGHKGNNAIENLEWASRKQNCDHAYSTGLRNDNHVTLVRNVFTNEIQSYYSYEECARKLNLGGETIRMRAMSQGQKIYPPGLQFKLERDLSTWKEFQDPHYEMRRTGVPIPLVVTHVETKESRHFKSIAEFAKFLGIESSGITRHFRHHGEGCIIRDYITRFDISNNN